MVPEPALQQHARVAEFQRRHRLALLSMLFTDMVGSMQLKQTLGDHAAMRLIARHHQSVRELLARFPDAEEIEYAGDSFFIVFSRPSDAVQFALLLQHALRGFDASGVPPLRDRVGIHVGEVLVDDNDTRLLGGLQIDTCARLMALGGADQILLSRFTFDSARQALRGEASAGPLSWLSHGHYLFRGLDEPVEVCEVGETGHALLAAPPNTDKAHRCATPDGEPVLGWRPAVGQQVPGTSWVLERNLGAGGFGEVWLGAHSVLKQRRVFKFCFRADRVRSLKREVTIFRLLRERVGAHPHIVTVHDVYFDEPPFYIVMDYVDGAALPAWAEAQGGLAAVPLEARLEIAAQVADALQAAHDAGVIHRDVKPSNILVGAGAEPRVKLADFGIGQILSAEALAGITQLGFTQTMQDSYSGTQLYLPPELLAGQPATTRSDIYSLGVVLFQMLAGDFARPLTTDWADVISDPLLRDDLGKCFASDPQKRFEGAAQLAARLRTLPQRQAARAAEAARLANLERQAYRRGLLRAAAVAVVIVAVIAVLAVVAWVQGNRARASAGVAARERDRAEQALTRLELQRAEELLTAHNTAGGLAYLARVVRRDSQHRTAGERLLSALRDRSHALPLTDRLMHEKLVLDTAFSPDGTRLAVTTYDTTRIWDVASGRLLVGPLPFGGFRAVFTADGARLIVMGFDGRIVDAQTGQVLATLAAHPGSDRGEARPDALLSPDGQRLFTISAHRNGLLWDAQTGQRVGGLFAHPEEVWCARFSPDGRQIVTGGKEGRAYLWEAQTGVLLRTWDAGSRVVRIAFSPDGARIAGGLLDGRVQLWDAAGGVAIGSEMRHAEEVSDVAFSPDGAMLLSTSHDGSARLWDAMTGEARGELPRTRYRVLGGGYSPDGLRLLTRTAEGVVLIRAAHSHELVVEPIRPDAVPLVAVFSPDGTKIATGGADGAVRVWQAEPRAAEPLRLWHGSALRDAASDGEQRAATVGADGSVRLWDLKTARATGTLAAGSPVALVRLSPSGASWLTAGDDGAVRLGDVASGALQGESMQANGRPAVAEFSADGQSLLIASDGQSAQVWDVATRQPRTPPFGRETRAGTLTPDGRAAVLAQGNGAGVWDTQTGQPLGTPVTHKANVGCVAVDAAGQRFASGSHDGTARVWSLATGQPASPELKHNNVVRTVSFSADGEWLVSTSYDQFARLWNTRTGQLRGEALAHSEVALAALFSPVLPQRVLTGSSDGFARLWDSETGALLAEPCEVGGPVRLLRFLPGGKRALACGEATPKATLWALDELPHPAPTWLADWAEAVGGRRLDDAGALQPVAFAALGEVRARVAAAPEDTAWAATARWFFAPRLERAIAPGSDLRLADYVSALGAMGSLDAALHGLNLAPGDARAWAQVALRTLEREKRPDAGDLAGLDWASRRAVELGANEAPAWLARGLVLEQRGEMNAAAAALDRAAALAGDRPDDHLRRARARVLALAGRTAEAGRENTALRTIPARDPQATDRQLDLTAYYNCRLDEDPIPGDEGNTYEELSRGLQTLGGITFDLRGMVQLGNRDRLRRFPLTVRGIAVGARCGALHFLHAAEFMQVPAGTTVARYVIHYEDGTKAELPLRNGRELGDWWGEPVAPLEAAWQGANRLTREKANRLNLFKTTWTNPRPEVPITALDFISAGTPAAPFVVAISRD